MDIQLWEAAVSLTREALVDISQDELNRHMLKLDNHHHMGLVQKGVKSIWSHAHAESPHRPEAERLLEENPRQAAQALKLGLAVGAAEDEDVSVQIQWGPRSRPLRLTPSQRAELDHLAEVWSARTGAKWTAPLVARAIITRETAGMDITRIDATTLRIRLTEGVAEALSREAL